MCPRHSLRLLGGGGRLGWLVGWKDSSEQPQPAPPLCFYTPSIVLGHAPWGGRPMSSAAAAGGWAALPHSGGTGSAHCVASRPGPRAPAWPFPALGTCRVALISFGRLLRASQRTGLRAGRTPALHLAREGEGAWRCGCGVGDGPDRQGADLCCLTALLGLETAGFRAATEGLAGERSEKLL